MHRSVIHLITVVSAITLVAPAAHGSVRDNAHAFNATLASSTPDIAPDSADVAGVVNAYHRALAAGDSAAAMTLLAPDAIIQESGSVETRSEYAGHHLPGDMRFAKALPGVRSAQRVVVVGDVAWSTSTSVTKGKYRDRDINSVGAELMVLARVNGVWRIRAIHWSSRTPRS